MNTLDLLIAFALISGLVHGFTTGVVKQVASIASIVIGLVAALNMMNSVGAVISPWMGASEELHPIIGFVTVLASVQILFWIGVKLFESIISAFKLTSLNRVLGAGVGMFKVGLLLSIFFLALGYADFPREETRQDSVLYHIVAPLLPATWDRVDEYFPQIEEAVSDAAASESAN